ncbi:MAG: hypothetical protein ACLRWQ_24095 [Flavonifractor plautii]
MGFWQAPAVTMAKFRARIAPEPKAMEKLARRSQKQDVFVLEGGLQAPQGRPTPGCCTPGTAKRASRPLPRRPHGELRTLSHDLADLLLEGYEFLLPYYEYMLSLSGDPDPRAQ